MNKNVKRLGLINTIEGYSYLVLLFIAMPLKYLLNIALAVKIAGMIHGIFFVLLVLLLIIAYFDVKFSLKHTALFFIASLIPFGTFYTKNKIAAYE